MTVAKYLNRVPDCDILIVDECSTVCNSDMKSIIDSNRFKLLLLVGDVRQIESIKFGNWFSLARDFLPDDRVGNVGVTARLLHPSFPSDLAKLPVRENNGSSVAPRSQGCGAPD